MSEFEEIPAVSQFFRETRLVVNQLDINQEKMFKDIEENFKYFFAMNMSKQGYLNKLAFISSILRAHNLKHLSVVQSFESTALGSMEEKFTCTAIAESYNSDNIYYKPLMIQRFETLKAEVIERNSFEGSKFIMPKFRMNSILQQKNNIKSLFSKILLDLENDESAALALTSFFLFEIENLSLIQTEHAIAFYDLFDRSNPLDKWFAAYKIKGKFKKPTISIQPSKILN